MPADRLIHPRAGHSVKVNGLTDLEFRVWVHYLLAADDFGVLRDAPIAFQASSDALAARKSNQVKNAVQHILEVELLQSFEHQGQRYLYQRDWQVWQKVSYPRGTDNPIPPADALELCDQSTRELFRLHPGGKGRKFPKRSENVSETVPKSSENVPPTFSTTRAGAPADRLTLTANASGDRLTAHANGSGADEAFERFRAAYPESGRMGGYLVQSMYFAAFEQVGEKALFEALVNHKASERWQSGKIPGMDKWLKEQRWLQTLEPPKIAGTTEKTAGNAAALQRFVERHSAAN